MRSCPLQSIRSVKNRLAQARITRKINLALLEILIFPPEIASSLIKSSPFLAFIADKVYIRSSQKRSANAYRLAGMGGGCIFKYG